MKLSQKRVIGHMNYVKVGCFKAKVQVFPNVGKKSQEIPSKLITN